MLGAGGAVGQVAVGAARLLGAGRVVAVCRSAAAAGAGARRPVPTRSSRSTATPTRSPPGSQDACGGQVDVVVDPVFGVAATAASRVLAEGGRLVNLGGASGDVAEFSSAVLRSRVGRGPRLHEQRAAARRSGARHSTRSPGTPRPGRLAVAHEVLPLARVGRRLASPGRRRAGVRLVLTP